MSENSFEEFGDQAQSHRFEAAAASGGGDFPWYYASPYHAPKAVAFLSGKMPRFGHSKSFSDIASLDAGARQDYKAGIYASCGLLLALFLVWGAAFVFIKFRLLERCKKGECLPNRDKEQANNKEVDALEAGGITAESESDCFEDDLLEDWPTQVNGRTVASQPKQRKSLLNKHRAGLIILISAFCILICTVFLLLFEVSSMREATRLVGNSITDARDVINEGRVITSILFSTHSNIDKFRSMTQNSSDICSLSASSQDLGDFAAVVGAIQYQMQNLDYFISENVTRADATLFTAQNVLNEISAVVVEVNRRRWLIPTFFLILGTAALSVIVIVVHGKVKGSSAEFVCKSWPRLLLPILCAVLIVCWLATLTMGFVALMSSDGCAAGGNPGVTAMNILTERQVEPQSQLYNILESYTGGCKAQDPTIGLAKQENDLRISINTIRRYLTKVDTAGMAEISDGCIAEAREFAQILDAVLGGVHRAKDTMKCSLVYPIYANAIHDGVCTHMANGASVAFLTLIAVSVCGMVIISLEGFILSKRKVAPAPKASEEPIAIEANEHEEYLEFISKYKHEWDEYHGFDASSVLSEEDLNASIRSNRSENVDEQSGSEPQSQELNTINESDENGDEEGIGPCNGEDDCSEGSRVWFAPPSTSGNKSQSLSLTVVSQEGIDSGGENGIIFDGIHEAISPTSVYDDENVGFSTQSCGANTSTPRQTPTHSSPQHFVFESASSGETSSSPTRYETIELEWSGTVNGVAVGVVAQPDLEEARDAPTSNRMGGDSEGREVILAEAYPNDQKPAAKKVEDVQKGSPSFCSWPINAEVPTFPDQIELNDKPEATVRGSRGRRPRSLPQKRDNEERNGSAMLDSEIDSTMSLIQFRRAIKAFEDAGAGATERLRGDTKKNEREQLVSPKTRLTKTSQGASEKKIKHLISKFDHLSVMEASNDASVETFENAWPLAE